MAIFLRMKEGEIYGGPDRESIINAMKADWGDVDVDALEEVPSTLKLAVTDENEEVIAGEFITLAEEYGKSTHAHQLNASE